MRTYQPINLIVYYPNTSEGKQELARRVANVHADAILSQVSALQCPQSQRQELFQSIQRTIKHKPTP